MPFKVKGDSNEMAYIVVVIGVILVLVAVWRFVGCNQASEMYVIDIDRLMDAEPEMYDQQLTEMVDCRLLHTNYSQKGIDDPKDMVANFVNMTYMR